MKVETLIEQILFSTVLIETQNPLYGGSGTGFVFDFPTGGMHHTFIVTNKHVIEDAVTGSFFFTKGDGTQPFIGQRIDIDFPNFPSLWHRHPDPSIDIAISPFIPILRFLLEKGERIFYKGIPCSLIPDTKQIEELDAMEEVIFVGYPNRIYDSVNLVPMIRRGTTATPVQLDYGGRPTFVIDASVFGGSSGSPVFIYNPGMWRNREGGTVLGTRTMFLGVLSAGHFEEGFNELITVSSSTKQGTKQTQMLDLGIVFKARAIVEVVKDFLTKNGVPIQP